MPVPGEQFVDVTGWMVGDAGQHVGDIELRIEAIEFGALDQRVHRGGAVAASVGAGEEIVLATDGHRPFILPMSGSSWKFTTSITPISVGRFWCAARSSERPGSS